MFISFCNQSDSQSDVALEELEFVPGQESDFFTDWHPTGSPEFPDRNRIAIMEEYFG